MPCVSVTAPDVGDHTEVTHENLRVVSQAPYTFGLPAPRRAGWELLEPINQHSCPTATKGRASDASEAVNTADEKPVRMIH